MMLYCKQTTCVAYCRAFWISPGWRKLIVKYNEQEQDEVVRKTHYICCFRVSYCDAAGKISPECVFVPLTLISENIPGAPRRPTTSTTTGCPGPASIWCTACKFGVGLFSHGEEIGIREERDMADGVLLHESNCLQSRDEMRERERERDIVKTFSESW